MPLDRKPIELCWKVAHGVLYTAHRLVSFGLNVPLNCLCGHSDETLGHLFFYCPLARRGLDKIQSILVRSSPLAPVITVRHVHFGFSSGELLCVPRVFCYLLSLLSLLFCFRFVGLVSLLSILWPWGIALRPSDRQITKNTGFHCSLTDGYAMPYV